jgi:hypothetical protein
MSDASMPHCKLCKQPEYACMCDDEDEPFDVDTDDELPSSDYEEESAIAEFEDALMDPEEGWQ